MGPNKYLQNYRHLNEIGYGIHLNHDLTDMSHINIISHRFCINFLNICEHSSHRTIKIVTIIYSRDNNLYLNYTYFSN